METGGDDGARGNFRRAAANDDPAPGGGPEARIEVAALRLARLLGRQIAREHFEAGPRRQRQRAGGRGRRRIGDPGP